MDGGEVSVSFEVPLQGDGIFLLLCRTAATKRGLSVVFFLAICSSLIPLSMLFLGRRWSRRPPANREGLSGYRTAMSRKNEDTWAHAHAYWGRLSVRTGAVLGALTVLVLIWGAGRPEFETVVTALVFLQLAAMALTILPTELHLRRIFTEDGRRKSGLPH